MVRAFQRNRQAIGINTNPQSLYKYYNKFQRKEKSYNKYIYIIRGIKNEK